MNALINAVNNVVGTAIADGGTYVPTTAVHKFCNAISLTSNGIGLNKSGGYVINAVANVTATAVGNITASLYQDGKQIASSTVSAASIGDVVAIPLIGVATVKCGCVGSEITVVISGQATTSYALNITTTMV